MTSIRNVGNTNGPEFNNSNNVAQQRNQQAVSIFLVDDGDNKFGINDIQSEIKFDENILTKVLKEYIGKPFEEVKTNVLNALNKLIETRSKPQLPQQACDLITESVTELINDINSGNQSLPQNADKNKVLGFLNSDAVFNFPPNATLPDNKARTKTALLNVALSATKTIQQKKFSETELKTKVDNIKAILNETLKGKTFNGPAGSVSGEQILDIINNTEGIIYKSEGYGAGRGDSSTGQIILNLNGTYASDSDAELMKLIIHEALHCVYKTNGADTWDEELCCESQAIEITAQIIESEKDNPNTTFTSYWIPNYQRDITELANNKELLNSTMQTWLEDGYSNRPKNQSGDISILRDNSYNPMCGYYTNTNDTIDIQAGDVVFYGEKSTTIGKEQAMLESANLSNNGNSNVCRLLIPNKPPVGEIVFDGTKDQSEYGNKFNSTKSEQIKIVRNGEVIYTGKLYKYSQD